MPTEGATSISELNQAAPTGAASAGEGDDELRQLKTVLLASFPALDGLISNTGAAGTTGDTDPPDAATFSKLFENVRAVANSGAVVPVGMIAMWAGLETEIPSGWAICNGQDGTPDLRDRFVIGADDVNSRFRIGQGAGSNWNDSVDPPNMFTKPGGDGSGSATINLPDHIIAENNLPEHSHSMFTPEVAIEGAAPITGASAVARETSGGGDENQRYEMTQTPTSPTTVEPSVGRSSAYGTGSPVGLSHPSTDITIDGIEHSHLYLPTCYALAYIQFKGVIA